MVGRNWPLDDNLGPGEVYLTAALATLLNASVGTRIWGRFNASIGGQEPYWDTLLQYNCPDCKTNQTRMTAAETVWAPYVVKAIFHDFAGKFSKDAETYTLLIDHASHMQYLAKFLNPNVIPPSEATEANYTKTKLDHYVTTMLINLPPPRIDTYLTSRYAAIHQRLIHFSNRILFKLGFAQVYVDLPVLRGLGSTEMVSLFLGLILNVIIFILLFLSIVLIYSLLMISVETRTFEMGILRMIGMARPSLIALLLVQAFAYAIPAWSMGIVTSLVVYMFASSIVINITNASISQLISADAFGLATLVGILIPVAASILPIRAALGQNLQDSLDLKHNKTKAVEITLKRGEDVGSTPWTIIMIGIGLTVFGGLIYYVLPLGLLSSNFSLLMNVFLFILIGMLLGLVLVALNLQHMVERSLAWAFFFWESRGIRNLVVKNLVAHRVRNQKTSILYALSLGFIIFINVAYNIQIATLSEDAKRGAGAYMYVVVGGSIDPTTGHTPGFYKRDMEYVKNAFPTIVDDYAWVTKEIRNAYPEAVNLYVTNIGRWNDDVQRVFGVSPNFFRVAFSQYIIVKDQANTDMSTTYLPDELYTREGASRALMGSTYETYLGVKPHNDVLLQMDGSGSSSSSDALGSTSGSSSGGALGSSGGGASGALGGNGNKQSSKAFSRMTNEYIAQGEAFFECAPFFRFSDFPLMRGQSMVVSMPTFMALAGNRWKSIDQVPLFAFLIKFHQGTTDQDFDVVKEWLTSRISEPRTSIWDYRKEMEPFDVANRAIFYFFTFTTVVAMAISFFSLMSSMYTNISEQTKEIGVVRALGIPKSWVYRIYIYEAFLLVVASSMLGVVIGSIASYTMNSQQSLFIQLPLPFNFPWFLLLTVLGLSVLFAILSSCSPIRSVVNSKIVQILRGM